MIKTSLHPILVSLLLLIQIAHSFKFQISNKKNFYYKCLFMSSNSENQPKEVELSDVLGRGSVLVSQPEEFSHFFTKAVVLIYQYGNGETQGVILEKPSAFTLGETAPGMSEAFEPNTLYIGGEAGNDMAMMFHKYPLESGAKHIGNGIYLGGLKNAKELVAARKAHPKDFKFIFNYSVWPKGSLEKEIAEGKWDILTCPPDFLIREESTSLWSRCRAKLRSLGKLRSTTTEHDGEDD